VDEPGPEVASYHDLAALLRGRIRSGDLEPGSPVPSEGQLIRQYAVGRELVRRAFRMLRQEGLIEPVVGAAMRVKPTIPVEVITVGPGTTVYARMPDPDERQAFGIGEGVPVLHVMDPYGGGDIYPADRYVIRAGDPFGHDTDEPIQD